MELYTLCRPCNDKAKALKPRCFKAFGVAGAEGIEPSARGFGAKSTLSVKPRVKIQSPKIPHKNSTFRI